MEFLNPERQQYLINLLSETLPNSLKTETQLMTIGIVQKHDYISLQLTLSNGLIGLINGLSDSDQALWKSDFHRTLFRAFTTDVFIPISLLNLQPFNRMMILSIVPGYTLAEISQKLHTSFYRLHTQLTTTYRASVIGCFGSCVNDFFDIGASYKKARKLQEYSYIIGLGHCLLYDEVSFNDELSLIEYRYIHEFEHLLYDHKWPEIYLLIDKIKASLIKGTTNNSKTTYLYKEIFALTIRYLFDQLGSYQDIITQLNEGIIMFDHLFNDIEGVNCFYHNLLERIASTDNDTPYSLYIKKALHIVHTEYMQALSLNYIADNLSLSTAYLSRLFKKEVGMNFKPYLTDYRIQIAKKLLESTTRDMQSIAESVGYSSATQFIRVFRSLEGTTPSGFRHNLLG